jgi:hypothetical protein
MSSDSFIKSVKSIKEIVTERLQKEPSLRDDDRRLILNVWYDQKPEILKGSFMAFAIGFKNNEFASPESIRRCRQKIQELNPELRGSKYNESQDTGEFTTDQINKDEELNEQA